MRDVALVVPSIRGASFERFMREWGAVGLFEHVDTILMEDNPAQTFEIPWDGNDFVHLSWLDIDEHPWQWIIPRRSDTVRSYAYWYAWDKGYKYIMTLDDDCYPSPQYEDLVGSHLQMLNGRNRWYNTLNNVIPRGMPYYNHGTRQVHVNHGIWQGVLDYDAPHQLVQPLPEIYDHSNRIVPHGAYFPMCGMNVMWRADATVLMYHLLMGSMASKRENFGQDAGYCKPSSPAFPIKPIDRLPFDRFGDIWCGIIMKKVSDHLGWTVSTGTPYIHHDRASNPFTNLRKEANGIEANEWFWEKIDAVSLRGYRGATDCYAAVGEVVRKFGDEHALYWDKLGTAMVTWAELFV